MSHTTTVHGYTVAYEENAKEGIRYLESDLSYDEAKVFFSQAHDHGKARFEDDEDRDYTLLYHSGAYTLVRR